MVPNGAAAGPSAANDKWDAFSGAMEEPHGDAGHLAQPDWKSTQSDV